MKSQNDLKVDDQKLWMDDRKSHDIYGTSLTECRVELMLAYSRWSVNNLSIRSLQNNIEHVLLWQPPAVTMHCIRLSSFGAYLVRVVLPNPNGAYDREKGFRAGGSNKPTCDTPNGCSVVNDTACGERVWVGLTDASTSFYQQCIEQLRTNSIDRFQ